jgi:hypothetical protein
VNEAKIDVQKERSRYLDKITEELKERLRERLRDSYEGRTLLTKLLVQVVLRL